MACRTWTRMLGPLVVLIVCVVGIPFANGLFSPQSDREDIANRDARVSLAGPVHAGGTRGGTAYPSIDPSKPGATTWINYPADDVLPFGISIGVCDGVIVGVVSRDPSHPKYDLMCTRYVVGDVDATDITVPLWRLLDLEMPKPDGSIAELSVLRPLWWIEETGAKAGATIDLGMREMGISGSAKVLSIAPCNADSRDNQKGTEIVTGRIEHRNAEVWNLTFNGDTTKTLGVTANHPIYSFDRDDWVPAGELRIGERVRTASGTVTLTDKSKRATRETVHNLEVHRSHAYEVSQFAILAHNSNILNCTQTPAYRGGSDLTPKIDLGEIRIKDGMVQPTHGVSLDTVPGNVSGHGAPHRIVSIPDELQIIQRGKRATHFEIVPKSPMSLERFHELLGQIVLELAN